MTGSHPGVFCSEVVIVTGPENMWRPASYLPCAHPKSTSFKIRTIKITGNKNRPGLGSEERQTPLYRGMI